MCNVNTKLYIFFQFFRSDCCSYTWLQRDLVQITLPVQMEKRVLVFLRLRAMGLGQLDMTKDMTHDRSGRPEFPYPVHVYLENR